MALTFSGLWQSLFRTAAEIKSTAVDNISFPQALIGAELLA
jgi:hypothetical protein